jgi:hypothetical protein
MMPVSSPDFPIYDTDWDSESHTAGMMLKAP